MRICRRRALAGYSDALKCVNAVGVAFFAQVEKAGRGAAANKWFSTTIGNIFAAGDTCSHAIVVTEWAIREIDLSGRERERGSAATSDFARLQRPGIISSC